MSNLNTRGVCDYETASKFLGGKYQRTLCFATLLVDEGACIQVRHHNTGIIRYWKQGTVQIRNGGWVSATTSNRLHRMTPPEVRVSFAKGGSVSSPAYNGGQPHDWTTVVN